MLDSLTGGLISDAVVVAVLGLTICGIALTGLAWLGCMALDHACASCSPSSC